MIDPKTHDIEYLESRELNLVNKSSATKFVGSVYGITQELSPFVNVYQDLSSSIHLFLFRLEK